MSLRVWKITKKGKRVSGKEVPNARNPIMDYLYDLKRGADSEEIATQTGKTKSEVLRELSKYKSQGLVEEITETPTGAM